MARIQEHLYRSLDDVIDDFPGNIDFPGVDRHDHHVHSAAMGIDARYLITNDAGFGDIDPDKLPYEVHSADSFFMLIAENMPAAIDAVITRQLAYYYQRGTVEPLDKKLEKVQCQQFAECVRSHVQQMANAQSTSQVAKQLRERSVQKDTT